MIDINIVVLGVIIAIIFYEITGISPGGIVVPGLLVLYINQPVKLIYTILIAVASYLICKLLSKRLLIFGKRRFVVLIVISILLNLIISNIVLACGSTILVGSLIGYTISGLLANDLYKQGPLKTIPAMIVVTGILECIVLISQHIG